ncbi:MAG: hypothetical protein ACI8TQ_000630 [Planctomycetota bacterium]
MVNRSQADLPLNRRKRALEFTLSTLLLLCTACDDSHSPTLDLPNSIRLSDLLDAATIQSPLTEISAASDLKDLESIQSEVVFSEDFEEYNIAEAGHLNDVDEAIVETEFGRSFLLSDTGRRKPRAAWVIPVQPNTYYLFERSVKTNGLLSVDFEILEADKLAGVDELLTDGGHTSNALLKVHWPPDPASNASWEPGSVSFRTMSYTRALVIVLWRTDRSSKNFFSPEKNSVAATRSWFDNARLFQLKPSREESIALVKAMDLAEDANPELGIRKFGQFPPLHANGPEAGNYSFRHALYAPPPTDFDFGVQLEPNATLRFAIALSRESSIGSAADFEIEWHTDDGMHLLWSQTLRARPEEWQWHEAEVDLSMFAGQAGRLVLKTRAQTGEAHPMWGNPTVHFAKDAASPSNIIMIAVDTLRADRLSSYGYERSTSPRIDELAEDGVRFENAISNTTWTCPSFASIFTGLTPSRHGVWTAAPFKRLPTRFETLAERFRSHGWTTHAIAYKAPLYGSGYDQGFDVSYIVPQEVVVADENLDKAIEWLASNAHRRSFLFLHFNDPHQPFCQPEPFIQKFGSVPDEIVMPFNLEAEASAQRDHDLARIIHEHADQTPRTTGTAGLLVPAGTLQILASSTT